jgi:mono/diheme cytochrome c family protein
VAGILFFVAMISAVIIFGVEKAEPAVHGEVTTVAETTTATATATTPAATTGDPAAGKAVFAKAGCGSCHTMKAAGATGTVGPNLDRLKAAYDAVVHQVESGGGGMPPFKGQLSDKEIKDVAAYVVASTHA